MRTYISDIIPKVQRFSEKLDNLTLLTNHNWVVIDEIENSKVVYIFRSNNELLISKNGRVERAKWEYIGNNSLLIDIKNNCYLFKQGFFDKNILALKVDGEESYAFLVNETLSSEELNSIEKINSFLNNKYIESIKTKRTSLKKGESKALGTPTEIATYEIEGGILTLKGETSLHKKIIKAELNGDIAPDGRYKLDFMTYVTVKNGFVIQTF
jgi:hypothetical protein